MRHLWSLIAGVVIAPLVWGLLAVGQPQSSATIAAWEQRDTIYTGDLLKPAAFLAAAGILLGLIATLRFSPAGALVAGLVYLVPSVGLFADPAWVRDTLPDDFKFVGQTFQPRTPLDNGTLLLLGLLLVIAALSLQRWRRWPVAEPAEPDTEARPEEGGEPGEPTEQLYSEPVTVPSVGSAPYASTGSPVAPPSASVVRPAADSTSDPATPRHAATDETTAHMSPAAPPSSAPPPWPPTEPAEHPPSSNSPWAGPPARRDETL